jgi:hypothetical protein
MKILLLAFALLLTTTYLAAQSVSPQGTPAKPNNEKCTVAGTVLRLDTGDPLKKAVVTLSSREDVEKSVLDLTDDLGHFRFEEVETGSYDLSVTRSGFVSVQYGQRKVSDPGAELTLHRGQAITDLVFKLQRTAVIAGRVFDEDGEPVIGAEVLVYRMRGKGKRREFRRVGRSAGSVAITDDSGQYRLFGLDPGPYYLTVNYQQWPETFITGAKPVKRLREGYLTAFYPNTTDPAKASFLVLGPGEEIPGIDFTLKLSPLLRVKGVVHNTPSDQGRSDLSVSLSPRDSWLSYGFTGRGVGVIAKDGGFEIQNVSPGSYNLIAYAFDADPRTPRWARRELEVGNADVEGLILNIPPATNVPGHLHWEGIPPAGAGEVEISLDSVHQSLSFDHENSVKKDGTFSLKNVSEGEYTPAVSGAGDDCYVKSARHGESSLTNGSLTIHPSG